MPVFFHQGRLHIYCCAPPPNSLLLRTGRQWEEVYATRNGVRIMARFKKDLYCNGQSAWQEADTPVLAGYGTEQEGFPIFQIATIILHQTYTVE